MVQSSLWGPFDIYPLILRFPFSSCGWEWVNYYPYPTIPVWGLHFNKSNRQNKQVHDHIWSSVCGCGWSFWEAWHYELNQSVCNGTVLKRTYICTIIAMTLDAMSSIPLFSNGIFNISCELLTLGHCRIGHSFTTSLLAKINGKWIIFCLQFSLLNWEWVDQSPAWGQKFNAGWRGG